MEQFNSQGCDAAVRPTLDSIRLDQMNLRDSLGATEGLVDQILESFDGHGEDKNMPTDGPSSAVGLIQQMHGQCFENMTATQRINEKLGQIHQHLGST